MAIIPFSPLSQTFAVTFCNGRCLISSTILFSSRPRSRNSLSAPFIFTPVYIRKVCADICRPGRWFKARHICPRSAPPTSLQRQRNEIRKKNQPKWYNWQVWQIILLRTRPNNCLLWLPQTRCHIALKSVIVSTRVLKLALLIARVKH